VKATDFERRHQTLLHLLLVGISVSTYLGDRVDIVWRLVRSHSDSAFLEHVVFGVGALMMLGSALLDTWANARLSLPAGSKAQVLSQQLIFPRYPSRFAQLLLASALGLLLPVSGALILLVGETILVLRLLLRDQESMSAMLLPSRGIEGCWPAAFRAAASKWGLTASMIVFAWTLRDRIAEIGAASSFLLWMVLNVPARLRSHSG
jgi:hypothetical protein